VLMRLARLYRGNDLSPRLLPGVPRSWPFVDAISLPGVLIKKHTLFSAPSFEASEHPVYLSQPVHVDEGGLWRLRPLATAKGHLRHVLQCVSGRKLFDTPAWTDDEDAVYLGAEPDLDSMARWARGIAVGGAPLPLFHAGGDPADVHWQQFAPDPIVREPLLIWNELRRRAAALHGHRASAR
ncbi:MAG: hypothetical protein K8H88_11630, partial [Sandaracinaceae bacterium]|nr:hypothetical protein [Sandaracinaceae bacterium]